ncbi:MAG: HPr family phosphocarrier protein [Christensenellales bacterium]|jgi:phosphocarrier protein HPr
MLQKEIAISNKDGLLARPAALLVQVASRYESQVIIRQGNKNINAKSIMGVLSLGIAQDEMMTLVVDGKDEEAAMDAILKLIDSGFEQMPE